jgi:hypothetical protein
MLAALQERHARLLRWLLISGWLLLVMSLLIPSAPPQGNRLFWGTVVPAGLLVIGAISHELWRRLCPLAFVSQLAPAMGWQRTRPGKGNKPELVGAPCPFPPHSTPSGKRRPAPAPDRNTRPNPVPVSPAGFAKRRARRRYPNRGFGSWIPSGSLLTSGRTWTASGAPVDSLSLCGS